MPTQPPLDDGFAPFNIGDWQIDATKKRVKRSPRFEPRQVQVAEDARQACLTEAVKWLMRAGIAREDALKRLEDWL